MPSTEPESILVSSDLVPLVRKPRTPVRSVLQQCFHFLVVGILAAGSYFFISHYLLQSVKVVGRSMVPTLYDSQHYLLNRWVYHFRPPRHSDIVVLLDPSD